MNRARRGTDTGGAGIGRQRGKGGAVKCGTCGGYSHWSHMECRNNQPHDPHAWDAPYLCYGPYLCPGVQLESGSVERGEA